MQVRFFGGGGAQIFVRVAGGLGSAGRVCEYACVLMTVQAGLGVV